MLTQVGGRKIAVIKEVRAVTGFGLKEAKQLVDRCPRPVVTGVDEAEARDVARRLTAVGASVETRGPGSRVAAAERETTYDIILRAPGLRPYSVVDHLMVTCNLDYDLARAAVDNPPRVIARALDRAAAERFATPLVDLGAELERVESESPRSTGATPSTYQVRLNDAGINELAVMIVIRDHAGCNLGEARDRVDSAPCVVARGLDLFGAERLRERLHFEGASTTIEPETPEPPAPAQQTTPTRAAAPSPAQAPAPAPAPAQTAPEVALRIRLHSSGSRKIPVIKALRERVRLGLKEAKSRVDGLGVIATGLDSEAAYALLDALTEAGASASIEADTGEPARGPAQVPTTRPAPPSIPLKIRLHDAGASRIRVIKALREHKRGIGLREAKQLVDSIPVLVDCSDAGDPQRLFDALLAAGASATLEASDDAGVPPGHLVRLVLTSYGARKIHVIKEVRAITGRGLKDTKQLVESAPCVIAEAIEAGEARGFCERLIAAGATARVEGPPRAAAPPPTPTASSPTLRILLSSFGRRKISVIKEVRSITGLGLKDTKDLVESAPCVIARGLDSSAAQAHLDRLIAAGATASLEAE